MAAISRFQQIRKLKTANWTKKVHSQFHPKIFGCQPKHIFSIPGQLTSSLQCTHPRSGQSLNLPHPSSIVGWQRSKVGNWKWYKKRLLWLYFQICTSTMRLPLLPSTWNAWTADGLSCVTLLLSSAQSLTNINGCFHSTQTGAQTCASQKSTWNLLARHPATSKVQSHTSQDFSTLRKDKQTKIIFLLCYEWTMSM